MAPRTGVGRLPVGIDGSQLLACLPGKPDAAEGEPAVRSQSPGPVLSNWPLLPGDIVVLCSDGLIEEGAFLAPEEMAELLRRDPGRPAESLALELAEAADARQRLPSLLEPEGFGDNITCIVIKVLPA